jgi:hypothetical protein
MCILACESVEGVFEALGLKETLMKAQMEERVAFDGKNDRNPDATELRANIYCSSDAGIEEEDATVSGPTEFRVKVLSASDLAKSNYRFGDFTKSLLCSSPRNIYVVVTFQERKQQSCAVATKDGNVNFGWTSLFSCHSLQEKDKLVFHVYDRRKLQAAIRGDPLIGIAEQPIVGPIKTSMQLTDLKLYNGSNCAGSINVGYMVSPVPDA